MLVSKSRLASFIELLMERHVLCVGYGGNGTHTVQVRLYLDPVFALANYAEGAVSVLPLPVMPYDPREQDDPLHAEAPAEKE